MRGLGCNIIKTIGVIRITNLRCNEVLSQLQMDFIILATSADVPTFNVTLYFYNRTTASL